MTIALANFTAEIPVVFLSVSVVAGSLRNGPVRSDDDLQLHGVLPENAPVVPGCAPARRDEKLPDLRQQKRLFRVSVHDVLVEKM